MTEQIERQEKVKNKPLRIIFAIMVLLAAIAFPVLLLLGLYLRRRMAGRQATGELN